MEYRFRWWPRLGERAAAFIALVSATDERNFTKCLKVERARAEHRNFKFMDKTAERFYHLLR